MPDFVVRRLNVADPVLGWRRVLAQGTWYTCSHRKEDGEGDPHLGRKWEESWAVFA
jgi:hypothetical protein